MSVAVPVWFAKESSFLASSTPRHKWMCDQLLERRKQQAQPAKILAWLQQHLTSMFGSAVEPIRIFEVLSDGLGYLEPSWHAVEYSGVLPGGSSEVDTTHLREEIKTLRRRHEGELGDVKTQRAIGGRLYESGLFLVTESASYFLDRGVWRQVVESNLPLKFPVTADARDATKECTDIDTSLTTLSTKVLWPGFFSQEPGNYFSLVFLHASLWQSASGVWAFHVRCKDPLTVPRVTDLNGMSDPSVWQIALQTLVDPAVRCLEDIVGWASEHEGTQARRRSNVDLFFRATGRDAPRWTADGVHGMFNVEDREVYEIAPSPAAADDIRHVFQLAIDVVSRDSFVESPSMETADSDARSVTRCLEALFVAGRLTEQLAGRPTPKGLLPSLPEILRKHAADELNISLPSDSPQAAARIAFAAADRINAMRLSDWKRWCTVVLRVVCLAGFAGTQLSMRAGLLPDPEEFLDDLLGVREAT